MKMGRLSPWLFVVTALVCVVQLQAQEHSHSHAGLNNHDDHHEDHRHLYSRPDSVEEEDLLVGESYMYDHDSHHGHTHGEGAGHGHGHTHGEGAGHGHVHTHGEGEGHGHGHTHGEGAGHGHVHTHGEGEGHGHTHGEGAGHGHGHTHGEGEGHGHVHTNRQTSKATKSEERNNVWLTAIGATLVVCAAPVLILPFIPIGTEADSDHRLLNTLLAFAAGGLLGDVFLHLLPHALDPHTHGDGAHSHSHSDVHDHSHSTVIGLWVMTGLMIFFLLEKAMRCYSGGDGEGHGHSHSHGKSQPIENNLVVDKEKKEKGAVDSKEGEKKEGNAVEKEEHHIKVTGYLNLMADFSHNFTDGLAIGASFLVSDSVGWTTTVAVLMHEVPHEIGDFAILVQSGFSKNRAMIAQLSTAIGALVGTVFGLLAKDMADSTIWILPITAGGFIYIATTAVLPELLKDYTLVQTIKE
eukprot:Ihof_evm9s174 gene=Ihof_evmTU9s174